jgi:hypothetical protein
MLNLFQHPSAGSATMERWTLKQVQGDGWQRSSRTKAKAGRPFSAA